MDTFERPEQHDQYLAWIAAHPNTSGPMPHELSEDLFR
jgi:hypothetical protein